MDKVSFGLPPFLIMNPQTVFGEIEKDVFTSLWDNMPDKYRKIVAADAEHQTSIFREFCGHVERDTAYRFEKWASAHPDPANSNEYLES